MTQEFRRPDGGRIDRSRVLSFEFNGKRYTGHHGDTLGSALIANGVRLVGRSFKYHRPRGIVATGADEPNALVQTGTGDRVTPNLRATQVPLHDGLVARSQNCWPSVRWDVAAVTGWLSPLLPAGFYYKTFMWPRSWWKHYEHAIRRAAGLGRAPLLPDPDRYEHAHAQVDVLVAGAGPAGLAAAHAAGVAGLRVMLVDEGTEAGGLALDTHERIGAHPAADWIEATRAQLEAMPKVTVLKQATVSARHDHGMLAVVEHTQADARQPAQRRWLVHAHELVLATGAAERLIAFVENDLPGVMLASAARSYVNRHAALPGRRAVVFTTNDSGYQVAQDMEQAGIDVACVVDVRHDADPALAQDLRCRDILRGHAVVRARGRGRVQGCDVGALTADRDAVDGPLHAFACDLILTAGGWSPRVHLSSHLGRKPHYDEALGAFLAAPAPGLHVAGACAGAVDLAACVMSGTAAGLAAARACGAEADGVPLPAYAVAAASSAASFPVSPLPPGTRRNADRRFVDLQADVMTRDLELAYTEGYRSIEHIKRYTTFGMGTDQGKTGNVMGLMHVAAFSGRRMGEIGTTTFRAPYAPVTLGTLAGRHVGRLAAPVRVTPLHDWHVQAGAVFMLAGLWQRAQIFVRPGESEQDAVNREARNVRDAVGITDVSPLGKLDLQGPDVATLLDRVYVNGWQTLAVGRSRYGVMLRTDGIVLDDGTTSRLADDRYFMTTTTGNAERIHGHLLRCLQVDWPELDVRITPVTEHWGAMAVAGPQARALLALLLPDFAIGNEAFPYMSVREGHLGAQPVRVFRISFAGELGYEIYTPADLLRGLWEEAVQVGGPLGLMPYGTEAMMVLRMEKGFFVPGFEADGRTTLADLGLGKMLSTKKNCIGRDALQREAFADPQRLQLVGVMSQDPEQALPRGAQLVASASVSTSASASDAPGETPSQGHLTSMAFSPNLDRWIGLALLAGGAGRIGEPLWAVSPMAGERVAVRIVSPVFVDAEGARTHG